MEITEFEKKRAANMIWNGAQDYQAETGFRVYDEDGRADIYWNSIIGVIHRHFDWDKLENFYNTFHETIEQTVYESLFWLALENSAYEKEAAERPVFPYLRKVYAEKQIAKMTGRFSLEDSAGQRLLAVTFGHWHHALGQDSGLPDLVDRRLLSAIELGPDVDTDTAITAISKALSTYFQYRGGAERSGKEHFLPVLNIRHLFGRRIKGDPGQMGPVRHLSFGYGEHVSEYGNALLDQSHIAVAFANYTAQTDEGLAEYIRNCFGESVFSKQQLAKLQQNYCYGNHTDVKLYFTRGVYKENEESGARAGYARKIRQDAAQQAKGNRTAYEKEIAIHRTQIEKLTARIRNSILTHLEDQTVRSNAGQIEAARIWRALYLDDDRVFDKILRGDTGNITVDICLDASTSQIHRQEVVAAQGYMIATALTRCGIPTKVYSFQSMNGYLIVNLYRDYRETDKNEEIFRYFTSGANRDGLAVRLAAGFMKDNHAAHRILILLSDCRPNDVIKMRSVSGTYVDYATDAAVEDTAAEVHKARMEEITVLGVFTGEDENLACARRIYGDGFVRIRELSQFADAVGSLIQNQIRTFA